MLKFSISVAAIGALGWMIMKRRSKPPVRCSETFTLLLNMPKKGSDCSHNAALIRQAIRFVTKGKEKGFSGITLEILLFGDSKLSRKAVVDAYNVSWDACLEVNRLDLECIVHSKFALGCKEEASLCSDVLLVEKGKYFKDDDFSKWRNVMQRKAEDKAIPIVEIEDPIEAFLQSKPNYSVYVFENKGQPIPKFKVVAVGGTFDHLHSGHKILLSLACSVIKVGGTLICGVTNQSMLKKKSFQSMLQSLEQRRKNVENFVKKVKPELQLKVITLSDSYGPTVHDPNVDAIICSSETLLGARQINEIRERKQWKPLDVIVKRRTEAETLSSTFIRKWRVSNL